MKEKNKISINLGPDPTPSGIESFDRRVSNIRKRAESDPVAARDELWSWVNEVSSFAPHQREEGLAELDRFFWQANRFTNTLTATISLGYQIFLSTLYLIDFFVHY